MNTNYFWTYFLWLLMQGLDFVRLPIVALICSVLTGGLIASVIMQTPFRSERWKSYCWLVLTQFLFLAAVATIGRLYRAATKPPLPPQVNPLGNMALDVLVLHSLALSCFWLYRMKDFRWFAFCLLGLQTVLLFGLVFVASMSVTGDWL